MGRIVVLGSLNTDLTVSVPALPSPGETVMGDRLQTFAGGKGGNQAVAAARLGGQVSIVGRVGQDSFGDQLLAQLSAAQVDTSGVERDHRLLTGVAIIMVDAAGQNVIAVAPGANGVVGSAEVERAVKLLDAGDSLLLQMEIPVTIVRRAIAAAKVAGARVILNAAPATRVGLDLLKGIDVLIANEVEAAAVFGQDIRDADDAAKIARMGADAGVPVTVVTLGAAGSVVWADGVCQSVAPFPVKAVDATAAGDAYVAAFAVASSAGLAAFEAARLANAAGAAAATRHGAQASLPTPTELHKLFGIDWASALSNR